MRKTRAKAIAKAYINAKFNGAEAGLKVFNTKKRKNASVMMRKALGVKEVQNEIQAELAKEGIDRGFINKYFKKGIEYNIDNGKPSQAVGAQLLIQAQKIYNYLPKDKGTVKKETRRVLLDKDFNIVKDELSVSITKNQELLNDINS